MWGSSMSKSSGTSTTSQPYLPTFRVLVKRTQFLDLAVQAKTEEEARAYALDLSHDNKRLRWQDIEASSTSSPGLLEYPDWYQQLTYQEREKRAKQVVVPDDYEMPDL